jgi:signal transduction histidine kinase
MVARFLSKRAAVQKTTGLRTEIIVNISLLFGAALLFSGFLLLKIAEDELLDQRVRYISGTMSVIAHGLIGPGDDVKNSEMLERSETLFDAMAEKFPVESWGLVDKDLGPVFFASPERSFQFDMAELGNAKKNGSQQVQVHYPSGLLTRSGSESGYVLITVPVARNLEFQGALQARFSLEHLLQKLSGIRYLIFIYACLCGLVVISFAVYLLSSRIVVPIQRFLEATRQIADGDLEKTIPVEGPRELSDLSISFNAMISALHASRHETETYIQSLERMNLKLEQARDELVRSEKMASVGHLAAGMAHEIGNPLGAALGYLEFLKADLGHEHKEVIERACRELGRIDRLVKDLLDYAEPGSSIPERLDMTGIAKQAVELLISQGVYDETIVHDDLPERLPEVFASRHKLLQVFINLMINARDAIPSGGVVRLAGGEEDGEVRISIEDSGPGIPGDILPHIFDPFFTTKDPGKGRGLGLSICQRIIEESGGRVQVESSVGNGSRFVVRLKKAGMENAG